MKNLWIVFVLLSTQIQAQEKAIPSSKIFEIGLYNSLTLNRSTEVTYQNSLSILGKVNGLVNVGSFQFGIGADGGTLLTGYRFVSPTAIVNIKFPLQKAYLYAGCEGGYMYTWNRYPFSLENIVVQGYVTGLHGGYVQPFAKHWSLTAELGIRFIRLHWVEYGYSDFAEYNLIPAHYEKALMLPVSLGIRYSF